MNQIFIFIFGISSIFLIGRVESWRKWGYLFGLLGQPFWYYESISNEQWGIMILSFFYTFSWSQGIYNYIIKPYLNNRKGVKTIANQ